MWNLPSFLIGAGVLLGPLATFSGVLDPATGFQSVFLPAVGLAILSAIGFGGAAAIATALGKPWRRQALIAAIVPMAVTVWTLSYSQAGPAINDITTDPANPPAFVKGELADAAYDPTWALIQAEAYPELAPIQVSLPPAAAYVRALATARAMEGWELSYEDAASGTVQARARTPIFRFVDDVVIRVTPEQDASRIDLRSRSHLGRGDLGANAARIRAYVEAFNSRR